jgi:hypothetical protein
MKTAASFLTIAAMAVLATAGSARADTRIDSDSTYRIHGSARSQTHYQIVVPEHTDRLEIRTSGGYGDLDLYLYAGTRRFGRGTASRSTGPDNSETIRLDNPRPGLYTLTVRGYRPYRGALLQVDFQSSRRARRDPWGRDDPWDRRDRPGWPDRGDWDHGRGEATARLVANRPVRDLSGYTGATRLFRVDVPRGARRLVVGTDDGRGDPDLYLSYGRVPTTHRSDHRSNGSSTRERISVDRPTAGTWYVMVRAYRPYRGVTLLARVTTGAYDPDPGDGYYQPARPWGRLTAPEAGDTWTLGNRYTIRWQSSDVDEVQVQYSIDGGRNWRRGANMPARLDADREQLTVNLPAGANQFVSEQVLIRLIDMDRRRVLDTAGPFRVVKARTGRPGWPRRPEWPDRGPGRAANPGVIRTGRTQVRRILDDRRTDRIRFRPSAPGRYVIQIEDPSDDLEVRVLGNNRFFRNRELAEIEVDDGDDETIALRAGRPGGWFEILVRAEDNDASGRYRLTVRRD